MKDFAQLEFSDDFIFGKVMQNKEICKEILEILLKIKIEKIEYPELQKTIKPFYTTKGVRLDVYVKNSDKVFDIELQSQEQIALGKRMRYYQSMLDIDTLMHGESYVDLKQSYVIFICKYDPFGKRLPVYTFKMSCEENREIDLNDNAIKMVYNAVAYADEKDKDLRSFLQYVCNLKTESDFTKRLESLVQKIKNDEEYRQEYMKMNLHDFDIQYAARNEGIEIGIQSAKIESAKNMLKDSLNMELVTKYTGLSLAQVQELKNQLKNKRHL